MTDYQFHLGGMDPNKREHAASAAKSTVSMKEGAGQELAGPMLRARDLLNTELQNAQNRQGLTFGQLPTGQDVKGQYDDRMNAALQGATKLRDHYQDLADHFIATELYFRNSDEQIAQMIGKDFPGTKVSY